MDSSPSNAQVPGAETSTTKHSNEILPRSPHRRKRDNCDRGLPANEKLIELARIYLMDQRANWPVLAKAGLLPTPTTAVLEAMVDDFTKRHRGGNIEPEITRPFILNVKGFGGSYNRYSCDNSDPKSIADQMVKALKKATEDGRFIPWCYVFCDYSVSGLDSSRQGYSAYKTVLKDARHKIDATYIDDFTRASRDELEWWHLAALSKRLGKGLIGASDNFNLADPDWDMKLTIFGLVSRLFIKSLKQKVKRGMCGTHRRGGTLGRPPLGYTRRAKRDANGNVQYGHDGAVKTELCFDPQTQPVVLEIFELFVNRRWTTHKMAKDMNRRKANEWEGWTSGGLEKILRNPAYVGVFIWNKTRREPNIETRKTEVIQNPRKDWIISYDPKLGFVPVDLWKGARRRLAGRRRKGNGEISRRPDNQGTRPTASTLFSDTLVCGYCQRLLRLYRSTSKFRDLYCPNGPIGNHGCKLTSSKSVRIVEECLLRYIQDAILAENNLAKLVEKANRYLAEESAKPREDLRPLKEKAKQLSKSIGKLVERVEQAENKELTDGYDRRIKELQKQLNDLWADIRTREGNDAPPPPPLDAARIAVYLQDLRAILNLETAASAEYLRLLTGPITIRQENIPGRKRGHRWIATFSANLMALLAEIAARKNYPDSVTLELLCTRIWIERKPIGLTVELEQKFEKLARNPEFLSYFAAGRNAHAISRLLNLTYPLVVSTMRFIGNGVRPKTQPSGKRRPTASPRPELKYVVCAPEAARLKDADGMSFPEIGRQLEISPTTAGRAYWYFHQHRLKRSASHGAKLLKAS